MRLGRHKTKLQRLDQLEVQSSQKDQNRERIRHRVRQMLSDSPTNQSKELIIKGSTHFYCFSILIQLMVFYSRAFSLKLCVKGLHPNESAPTSTKAESHSDDSAMSPSSPSSPPGLQSPVKCLTPPHQPSPPVEPPHPKNGSRLRRVSSLNRTRLSQSHSSGQ